MRSARNEASKVDDMIIRKAKQEEAAQIAELFLLAWPVDEIASSSGITAEQLRESVTGFSESRDTIYSYENTYVAEIDNKIVGAICGYDGADHGEPELGIAGDVICISGWRLVVCWSPSAD